MVSHSEPERPDRATNSHELPNPIDVPMTPEEEEERRRERQAEGTGIEPESIRRQERQEALSENPHFRDIVQTLVETGSMSQERAQESLSGQRELSEKTSALPSQPTVTSEEAYEQAARGGQGRSVIQPDNPVDSDPEQGTLFPPTHIEDSSGPEQFMDY